jgi:hypothetical protein
MKLELKHLAPYLPYELKMEKIKGFEDIRTMGSDINNSSTIVNIGACIRLQYKPILRPLSDLTKVNGFSLSDMISHGYHNPFWLPENFEVKYLMNLDFEKLVSWHFDVFGLIEKGLAIDINTIT